MAATTGAVQADAGRWCRVMRVLPILFNSEMVQAILDGRKTCTRRLIKPQPKMKLCYTFAGRNLGKWGYPSKSAHEFWGEEWKRPDTIGDKDERYHWTPPYHTDDILYVRETWQECCRKYPENAGHSKYCFKASLNDSAYYGCIEECGTICKMRPSIHMPKKAARIWLKITNVRVERLQDITEEQAEKEGASPMTTPNIQGVGRTYIQGFGELWNSTVDKNKMQQYGWNANPYVWVIEFERCEKPEVTHEN